MTYNKDEYLRACHALVAERDEWQRKADDENNTMHLRERASINVVGIQRDINDIYSTLLANGVAHQEIRGE